MAADPEVVRHAVRLVHGLDGPCVILSARTCALLAHQHLLEDWRARNRHLPDPELAGTLTAVEIAARQWREAHTGSAAPVVTTVAPDWYSTSEAADRLHMTPRGVRKAVAEGRLGAQLVAGRWRVSREAIALFRRTQ